MGCGMSSRGPRTAAQTYRDEPGPYVRCVADTRNIPQNSKAGSLVSSNSGSLVSSRSITPHRILSPKRGRVHHRLDVPEQSNYRSNALTNAHSLARRRAGPTFDSKVQLSRARSVQEALEVQHLYEHKDYEASVAIRKAIQSLDGSTYGDNIPMSVLWKQRQQRRSYAASLLRTVLQSQSKTRRRKASSLLQRTLSQTPATATEA